MNKYRVYAQVYDSKFIGAFEAENEEDAIKMALDEQEVRLCYHCSREIEDGLFISDENVEVELVEGE